MSTPTFIGPSSALLLAMLRRSHGRRRPRRSTALRSAPETAWLGALPQPGRVRMRVTEPTAGCLRSVIVAVDRFYPSSQTFSACGEKNAALALRDRRWICPACGADHDRDTNAATSIEREGLRLLAQTNTTPRSGGINARGEDACAVGGTSPTGQPTSTNRERTDRAARRSPRHARPDRTR